MQLLASVPNGIWIEDMGLSGDLFVDPVPIVNGLIKRQNARPRALRSSRRFYAIASSSRMG